MLKTPRMDYVTDIVYSMQLDDVVATLTKGPRVEEVFIRFTSCKYKHFLIMRYKAMYRSIRWLDRCIKANKNPDRQNLFAIIQGCLDLELRTICCEEMNKRDTPGIAIGGLSGGEDKDQYCKV